MKIYKRLISFFLVLAMMLGMVILPSPALASNIEDRNEEVHYTIRTLDGQSYKFYKYTDVIGKQEPSIGLFAVGEPIDEYKKYPIEVDWSTYDLKVADIKFPIVFEIVDIESGLTIAKTDENGITGSGQYYFNKTADWDDPSASHDPYNWSLGIPEALNFDVRN